MNLPYILLAAPVSTRLCGEAAVQHKQSTLADASLASIAMKDGLFNHPNPSPPVIEYLLSLGVILVLVTTLIAPTVKRPLPETKEKNQKEKI